MKTDAGHPLSQKPSDETPASNTSLLVMKGNVHFEDFFRTIVKRHPLLVMRVLSCPNSNNIYDFVF